MMISIIQVIVYGRKKRAFENEKFKVIACFFPCGLSSHAGCS